MSDGKKQEKTLEQQVKEAEQRLQSNELKVSKLRERLTKQNARKAQVLINALDAAREDDKHFSTALDNKLNLYLTSEADRKLFGLGPKTEDEETVEQQYRDNMDPFSKTQ